jgi:hypothetical protein
MRLLWIIALVGCSSDPGSDVVGPFSGEVHRFVIDEISVARVTTESDAYADDLDGDGEADNKLGVVAVAIAFTNDLTTNAADMIAGGSIASSIELQTEDLTGDGTVGVRYVGADGEPGTVAGGTIVAGSFRSNRTRETRVPGSALIRLPMFTNADSLAVELEGLEIDLDPDGQGGFDGIIRGAVRAETAKAAAFASMVQMVATEPERHVVFARQIDVDHDGQISRAEFDECVIAFLVSPDLQLFDGARLAPRPGSNTPDSVSLGFGVHLLPCPSGRCSSAVPADRCRDRVRDGDETDVDCGGTCQPCAPSASCTAPTDCQTGACDANRCRAPSCGDAVRDGFESDVDCGGVCGVCQLGQVCFNGGDCATGRCDNSVGSAGICVTP